MVWSQLNTIAQIQDIKEASYQQRPLFIFKHSTRCPISTMAYGRLKKSSEKQLEQATVFYLDVLSYREVSNAVSETFAVDHESPQILRISNGLCPFHASHNGITQEALVESIHD